MMALARRQLWFAVFVLVVFSTGLAGGIALDRYFMRGRAAVLERAPGPGVPGGPAMRARRGPRPGDIAGRMARELELTADQRSKLEAIFEKGADRMQAFHASTRQQFERERQQLDAEIVSILTPEQRAKFEEQRAKRRERFRRPLDDHGRRR
jgi:Spy/CpxP family protein refolding chaperone